MAFDLERTLEEMADAARRALSRDAREAKAAAENVLDDQREALEAIARARLAGEIDDEQMEEQLRDEKLAFQAGLSLVRAAGKAAVQKAANAAFAVLAKAIRDAAGIV